MFTRLFLSENGRVVTNGPITCLFLQKDREGGSDAYDFIYIKSIFKRAPDSIFHYNY